LSNTTVSGNYAKGFYGGTGGSGWRDQGGAGGLGGNGYGGGLYVASGTVTLSGDIVESNSALAGAGGPGSTKGSKGTATGGGLDIASGASVSISTSTDTISGNTPTNIVGSYTKTK
jgi:hypothetical protein